MFTCQNPLGVDYSTNKHFLPWIQPVYDTNMGFD